MAGYSHFSKDDTVFTVAEVSRYLDLINLPSKYRTPNNAPLTIDYLTALHVHQISTIPYENLSLHYSHDKRVNLAPRHLFEKFVTAENGRGGYCMEASLFFMHMLRALGFDVYPTGVRIRIREGGVPVGDYIGLFVQQAFSTAIERYVLIHFSKASILSTSSLSARGKNTSLTLPLEEMVQQPPCPCEKMP